MYIYALLGTVVSPVFDLKYLENLPGDSAFEVSKKEHRISTA